MTLAHPLDVRSFGCIIFADSSREDRMCSSFGSELTGSNSIEALSIFCSAS